MTNGTNLGIVSASLTKEEVQELERLRKAGHRGMSDQIRLLLDFYLEKTDQDAYQRILKARDKVK